MKTIDKCSIFIPEVEKILLDNKITNGLGGGGNNLEKIILEALKIIESEEGFNN